MMTTGASSNSDPEKNQEGSAVTTRPVRVYVEGDVVIKLYRIGKTAALLSSWVCLGLYNEVVGPTLSDLKERIGCNYEEIARALSARSAGLFLGSIVGGYVYDRWLWRRDLLIALALLLSAVTITLAPWCKTLWQLGIVFHLMGHSHGLLTTGANPLLAFLWAERAAGPFNLLHSGFGIGAMIGPLISRPFLSQSRDLTSVNRWTTNDTVTARASSPENQDWFATSEAAMPQELSRIEYPYSIVGLMCSLVACSFLAFYVCPCPVEFRVEAQVTPTDQSTSAETTISFRKAIDFARTRVTAFVISFRSLRDVGFRLGILCLMFFYYMFVVGGERAFGKYVFSFAVDSPKLRLSKSLASLLTTSYWIAFAVARLAAFVAARWVPIHWLLFVEISGTLAAAIGFNLMPSGDRTAFWLLTVAFGFFKSPLFPSCLGWANHYIEITSLTIAVVNIGSSTGGMLVQWLTGYAFEYHGPESFLFIIVAYSAAIFALYCVMYLLGRRHGSRFASAASCVGNGSITSGCSPLATARNILRLLFRRRLASTAVINVGLESIQEAAR